MNCPSTPSVFDTVTLFAALNYLAGKVLSTTAPRHTHVEWLAFLKKLHRETPKELDLHLIVDNNPPINTPS